MKLDSINTIGGNRLDSSNGSKYYDFDPFTMTGIDPVPDQVKDTFPFIEILSVKDSLIIKAHLNDSFSLNRKLAKKNDYYYEEYSRVEHGLQTTYKRIYSKTNIIEWLFSRDLANEPKPSIEEVTSFSSTGKIAISPNVPMTLEVQPHYDIYSFPESKIAMRITDNFHIKDNCLMIEHRVKSYHPEDSTSEKWKYCFNKYPFNKGRFSYFWYILLPDHAEAWMMRDILKKYSESQ